MWGTYETYASCRTPDELLRWLEQLEYWRLEEVRVGVLQAIERLQIKPRSAALVAIPHESLHRYGIMCKLGIAHYAHLPAWAAFLGKCAHSTAQVGEVAYGFRDEVDSHAGRRDVRRRLCELNAADILAGHRFVAPRGVTTVKVVAPNFAYACCDWDTPLIWWVCTRVGAVRARDDFDLYDDEPLRLASALGVPVDLAARLVGGDPDEVDAEFAVIVLAQGL